MPAGLACPLIRISAPSTNFGDSAGKVDLDYSSISEMQRKARNCSALNRGELFEAPSIDEFCYAYSKSTIDSLFSADRHSEAALNFFDVCKKVVASGRRIAIARDVFVHRNR